MPSFPDEVTLPASSDTVNPFLPGSCVENAVTALLANPSRPDFLIQINKLATFVRRFTSQHPNASLAPLFLFQHFKGYAARHSLHVAILSCILTEKLAWPEEDRHVVACAALTMNIGMFPTQQVLSEQWLPPTPSQARQIEIHPDIGVGLLRQAGVTGELWLQAVRWHHDGPSHRAESPAACLLHMLDLFCAKVSPRKHRMALSCRRTYRELSALFHRAEVDVLCSSIGEYPAGVHVTLANGEHGVVTEPGLVAVHRQEDPSLVILDTSRAKYAIMGQNIEGGYRLDSDIDKLWPLMPVTDMPNSL